MDSMDIRLSPLVLHNDALVRACYYNSLQDITAKMYTSCCTYTLDLVITFVALRGYHTSLSRRRV